MIGILGRVRYDRRLLCVLEGRRKFSVGIFDAGDRAMNLTLLLLLGMVQGRVRVSDGDRARVRGAVPGAESVRMILEYADGRLRRRLVLRRRLLLLLGLFS